MREKIGQVGRYRHGKTSGSKQGGTGWHKDDRTWRQNRSNGVHIKNYWIPLCLEGRRSVRNLWLNKTPGGTHTSSRILLNKGRKWRCGKAHSGPAPCISHGGRRGLSGIIPYMDNLLLEGFYGDHTYHNDWDQLDRRISYNSVQ